MAELLQYKCPCCGGAIEFNSTLQEMKCPYCDTCFDLETLKEYDADLQNDADDDFNWESKNNNEWRDGEADGLRYYVCNSCGGEIIGDETLAATVCPYCSNPVIMMGQLKGELKPDYVIPFKVNREAAKAGLKKHLLGKKLLPKVFKTENHIDEIKGIYVPFWLFDTNAQAHIRYKGTKVRHYSDSKYMYTETSHFSIVRGGNIGFCRVPVDGSSKMADDLMESIEPYDFKDAVDFQTAYLSGFLADKYDVSSSDSIVRANERVKKSTEQAFADTVHGYSSVQAESSSIKLNDSSVKYALYPVWLLNTTWRGEKYTFAMNGQTGKFVGNLPVDKGLYNKYLWGITAAVGAACFVASYLIWLL